MANPFLHSPLQHRDGTSQPMRRPAALDPEHARVDERTTADLLAFARQYGKELVYHDDGDRPDGDFGAFLGPDADLDALAALVDDPQSPRAARALGALRPHTALFLAFVALLRHGRDHMNTLTRRHLDFHLRAVLGLSPRPPVPDRAHVIVKLARKAEQALLPAGTLLDGGKDESGKDRLYRTDRDVVASRAEIARLSSVFVEREITTLRSAREAHPDDAGAALLSMLSIALGDPLPGDPLPPFEGAPVDLSRLLTLKARVAFAREHLFLELHEISEILQLVEKREQEAAERAAIHEYLLNAGRSYHEDPAFTFSPADPRDFDADVATALGTISFGALPDVLTLEDVYNRRARQDVRDFILIRLHFANVDDFAAMMRIKLRIDAEHREIHRLLELAGRRKRADETYRLSPPASASFADELELAVGPVDWTSSSVTDLEDYQAAIAEIERAFSMPAEDFAHMMSVHAQNGPTEKEWAEVEALLHDAHARLVYERRRQRIEQLGKSAATPVLGLSAVVADVLGADFSPDETLEVQVGRLLELVPSAADMAFLQGLAQQAPNLAVISDASWARVALVLERAKRVKEGFSRPVARKIVWLDIHPHDDAAAVAASAGGEADRERPPFHAFGAPVPRTDQAHPPAPVLGWAFESPLLSLGEGTRTIALTLGFQPDGFDAARIQAALEEAPFVVQIDTAKGPVIAAETTVTAGDYASQSGVTRALPVPLPSLRIQVALGPEADAVAAPAAGSSPVLRLMLRPVWNAARQRHVTLHEPFQRLVVAAVHARVSVSGLHASALQNDRSILDPRKPFEPFGPSPGVGSRLYLGHPELCGKKLGELAFHVEWQNAPASLSTHYANYGITPDFKARIFFHDRGRELELAEGAPLFDAGSARNPHLIAPGAAALSLAGPQDGAEAAAASSRKASEWRRHLVWELLSPDFQHHDHLRVAAQKAGELALAIAQSTPGGTPAVDVGAYQVQAPYTPVIKRLRIDYAAWAEAVLDAEAGAAAAEHRVHHVHPFGRSGVPLEAGRGAPLLPRYDDHEGALYIGLRDVHPPQTLSILFQMAEGTADPDLEPRAVQWSALDGDRWVSLHDGHLLSDGARGLLRTGILELSLDRVAPSALLPGGLYWLRAAVREGARSVCHVMSVHTQAVSATYLDGGDAAHHHGASLPAGTITKLVHPVRGIASVEQPHPTCGGRPAERDADLHVRASERLRHRGRALAEWDYERIVLAEFPEIYRVKCLPAGALSDGVALVVVPDIRHRIPFDPFDLEAPAATLEAISAHLAGKAPPHARIEVKNAHLVAVMVRVSVRFSPGSDEGFYKKKLSDEIGRFLSPWAFDEGADISMGNRIHASSIVDFVDRRPYVDHVAGIDLLRSDGGAFSLVPHPANGAYSVSADRPDGVLVTAREHEIDTSWFYRLERSRQVSAEAAASEPTPRLGIGAMRIGMNFIVMSPPPAA